MTSSPDTFADLGLAPSLLETIKEIGYETPSPIQAASIPHLLAGKDILGQAQTALINGQRRPFLSKLMRLLSLGHFLCRAHRPSLAGISGKV